MLADELLMHQTTLRSNQGFKVPSDAVSVSVSGNCLGEESVGSDLAICPEEPHSGIFGIMGINLRRKIGIKSPPTILSIMVFWGLSLVVVYHCTYKIFV